MRNLIRVTCDYYFRGVPFNYAMELDLDEHMAKVGHLSDIYPMLAMANDLDTYSYQYDMLVTEPLVIEALEGWVAEHIHDQQLDVETFEEQWHQRHLRTQLQEIAQSHALECNDNLLAALTQAYQLGIRSKN